MKAPRRRQALKAFASDRAIDTHDRRRTVITAEGLRLPFLLASRAARAGALAMDLVLIVLLMAGTTVLLVWLAHAVSVDLTRIGRKGSNGPGLTFEVLAVFWFITMFLFRHAYFLFFELGPRGATPGKRLAGVRVAARASNGSGGRLTTEAVIARNLIRDIELFLPFVFVMRAWSEGGDTDLAGWASLAWFAVFVLFPFFNKDRLRCGDVIAGTWVVEAPRNKLKQAISTRAAAKGSSTETGATYRFGAAELAVYGEYELKVLEGVLHDRQDEAMRAVAASIARKIGWDAGAGDEAAFLEAYYTQLRARLEGDMRFGKRKKDKFAGVA
ncbi:RDD family protein [Novosphingobium sp.]|uniref:RDD family protein n=1 Tax=Novosphingobium sp. TaxID=1874826 RepID=UPI0025F4AA56|nr:RDD family protein [Novosphingobium sp.]